MDNTLSLIKALLFIITATLSSAAAAIPSLQLSGDGSSEWSYEHQTWVAKGSSSFNLLAYANASAADGGNGDFAWDDDGAADRYAYLIVAAVPDLGNLDSFDISISGTTMVTSGHGNPPIEDSNSISPHGIFDTYFEVYEFRFDGPIGDISDQQPGKTGTGKGYSEALNIDINSMLPDLSGLHFDLFTVKGDGKWIPDVNNVDKHLVNAVAPYSHDAEYEVPEPGIVWLLGSGLLGLSLCRYRRP